MHREANYHEVGGFAFHIKSAVKIEGSAPVSTGNTFQDLPRLRQTTDNTERYI
jgi:hypothetical protein